MNGDSIVFQIEQGSKKVGSVFYCSGEYFSDDFNFSTRSSFQAGTVKQLEEWMDSMKAQGYEFNEPA
jgi:hypothetical protein